MNKHKVATFIRSVSRGSTTAFLAVAVMAGALSSAGAAEPPRSASEAMVLALIGRLVERGVLSAEEADELVAAARAEAEMAVAAVEADTTPAVAAVEGDSAPAVAEEPGVVRVSYVPRVVREEIRDDLRREVMDQARREGWASPSEMPSWVSRFSPFGDLRVRHESTFMDDVNDNSGSFPDFNAINRGSPFDTSGLLFSPQFNADQERHRQRLRARMGVAVDLGDNWSAAMRLATGNNASPVSTNQTLGSDMSFGKMPVWLDRAFASYDLGEPEGWGFWTRLGRMDNPFHRTSGMVWDGDLGFDGIAIGTRGNIGGVALPFLRAGAFPIFNTAFDFATNQPDKFKSEDRYLYSVQVGSEVRVTRGLTFTGSAGLHHFDNIEGRLSEPFVPFATSDRGDTDHRRPLFAQKGNTYMALRDIQAVPANGFGTFFQYQYYGLASKFLPLVLAGELNFDFFEPFRISLFGEWVRNLAYEEEEISPIAVNNRGTLPSGGGLPGFDGGDTAWLLGLRLGPARMQKAWDWQVTLDYRLVETDALVDGFAESDFGLGGTNVEGYTISGALNLSQRVRLGTSWLSSREVTGPPFRADVLQVDFNATF